MLLNTAAGPNANEIDPEHITSVSIYNAELTGPCLLVRTHWMDCTYCAIVASGISVS